MRIIALLPLLALGCTSGKGATCGWRFEMGKAGEVYTNIPYQQNTGPLGVLPLGQVALDSQVSVMGATRYADEARPQLAEAVRLGQPVRARAVVAPASDCTMDEICALLRALAAKQGIQSRGMDVKPMPKE